MTTTRSPVHVTIDSFQSIDHLEFTIDGFTCVTGPTNIGKSGIMRAVSGALRNIPVVGLVRKGAKYCSVKLHSDDWGFLWEKGAKSVNRYWLLDSSGEKVLDNEGKPKVLDKIGQGQVEEIANMGFGSVQIGDEVIYPWYADQFRPVFLLNKSGPAVTDFFSEVAHLKVLQDSVVLCARRRKWALDEAKAKGDELISLRDKEKQLDGLDTLITLAGELGEQAESISEYEKKVAKGTKYQGELHVLREVLLVITQPVKLPSDICGSLVERLKKMHALWADLETSASYVRTLRAISTVEVSDPPAREFESYKSMSRFSDIPQLQKAVSVLDPITSINLPSLSIDINDIKSMEQYDKQIKSLRRAVNALDVSVTIPDIQVDILKLCTAETLWKDIAWFRAELTSLDLESHLVVERLAAVQSELDSIPNCDACGRPTFSTYEHEHQATA